MYRSTRKSLLIATLALAVTALAGCNETNPLSTGSAFGTNASAVDTSTESSETAGIEEETESTAEAIAPEGIPVLGTRIVPFNNFQFESFSLSEQTVVYFFVDNPAAHQFDAWLVDEAQLDTYRDAIAALPASALETHQNFQADYGIDLGQSIADGVYVNFDLPAGDYSVLIDNTDLGDANTFNDDEIDYQFSVFFNGEDFINSN